MFGQNSLRQPKRFACEPNETLLVTSLFPTLQGEGPFAGHPAIFLRLAYCNLKCSFCDTYFDHGTRLTFAELDQRIAELQQHSFNRWTPLLVVTGGEPLMQRNLADFLDHRLHCEQHQIETNGNFYLPFRSHPVIVISPKANDKGHAIRLNLQTLQAAQALKFVIAVDMPGYIEVPKWALDWRDFRRSRQIYLSPMNRYARQPAPHERVSFWEPGLLDMQTNQRNHEYAAQLAMKHGCILSIQQHLYANLP